MMSPIRLINPSFFFGLLLLCLGLPGCKQPTAAFPIPAQQDLDALKMEFAPDKRVAIFEITPALINKKWVLNGQTNQPGALEALKKAVASWEMTPAPELNIALLPAPDLAEKTWGIVNVSVCNIRSEAGHSKELSTQALLGTVIRVYKKEGEWSLIQTPDQYLGWLDPGGFIAVSGEEAEKWQQSSRLIFTADYGIARSEPDQGSLPVGDLVTGDILLDLGREGNWARLGYPDGRTAWAPAAELTSYTDWLADRDPVTANILATANTFIGRPYLWGGASPKGMDCSGFTKTVYYLNGLVLPRDASQQVTAGEEVPTDSTLTNLVPGDFLFFGRKATTDQKEKITHVGIYIGDGRMIHSGADNPGVRIQSLRRGDPDFAPHRLETLVRARRMTPGENGVGKLEDVRLAD